MTDSGVVDQLRVPDWLREPVVRAWRESAPVVRAFVILAFADVLSRSLGILQPRLAPGADLFAIYQVLIPHDLWIVLPAILVLRRPDAATATPLVFWGSVVVALATAFGQPLTSLFEGPFGASVLSIEVQAISLVALLVGLVLAARGLVVLNPAQPTPTAAGLSNLVVGLGAIGIAVAAGQYLLSGASLDVPEFSGALLVDELAGVARSVAWLYLLWVVIRGLGDARRSAAALTVAAVGAVLAGLFDPTWSLVGQLAQVLGQTLGPGDLGGFGAFSYAMNLLSSGVGEAAVVVAFALGLAEPPVPYVSPAPPEIPPAPEAPQGEPDAAILPG